MSKAIFTRTAASLLGLATLAALDLAAAPASAQTTINFDNFTAQAQANGGQYSVGKTYSTQGFTFNSNGSGFTAYTGTGSLGDGETSLYDGRAATTTLTQDNGQTFSFNAIDIGPIFGNTFANNYDGPNLFTGTRADGTMVTATATTNSPSGHFQTFDFTGFTDLKSLTFASSTSGNSIPQFDNIVLSSPAAVPEASTTVSLGLLLALGLGGLAVSASRKAKVAA